LPPAARRSLMTVTQFVRAAWCSGVILSELPWLGLSPALRRRRTWRVCVECVGGLGWGGRSVWGLEREEREGRGFECSADQGEGGEKVGGRGGGREVYHVFVPL
jgi:hypothetical protein